MPELFSNESLLKRIFVLRGEKVLLDSDLAQLYVVATKVLNQAVQRNIKRFPADFMFQLTEDEIGFLRSQIATSSLEYGGRRYLPYAFTEQGIAIFTRRKNEGKRLHRISAGCGPRCFGISRGGLWNGKKRGKFGECFCKRVLPSDASGF